MSKKIKKSNGMKYYIVISLVACLGVGAVALAYSVGQTNNTTVNTDGGDYVVNNATDEAAPNDLQFGAQSGTDLTVDNLTYGSSRYKGLTFIQGATSTVGGLFTIDNYGPDKICDRVELDIFTAQTTGGISGTGFPLGFSVGTSTIGSLTYNTSLIASTTVATSSTMLLDSTNQEGTGVAIVGQSFLWEQGDSIHGQYNTTGDATTTAYGIKGGVYITCHER